MMLNDWKKASSYCKLDKVSIRIAYRNGTDELWMMVLKDDLCFSVRLPENEGRLIMEGVNTLNERAK